MPPLHFLLSAHSPRHVGGEAHPGECPDGLVGQVQGVEGRPVNHIWDQLVTHEDVLEEVGEDEV